MKLTDRLPEGAVTARWTLLKRVMREVGKLGVELRIVGADIEISHPGEIPTDLHEHLEAARADGTLWGYVAADEADYEATSFLGRLHVESVLVEDPAQLPAALRELVEDLEGDPGAEPAIGIDIETGPDDWRPVPVAINRDGTLAARQGPKKLKASERTPDNSPGLYPHRAGIQTLQLYAGGERCFVIRGGALRRLLRSPWLHKQPLVAHQAKFEAAFLSHHTGQPTPIIACTQQAAGLLFGVEQRGLAVTCRNVFGVEPPKEFALSCWAAPRLSPGQVAYAATDAVLAYHLWPRLRTELQRKNRIAPYTLQAGAIPAVVAMELRGLGFDQAEHASQAADWAKSLAAARQEYQQLTGNPPPSKQAEIRAWLEHVAADKIALGRWPVTPTGLLSTAAKHLKRLVHVPSARPVLEIMAKEKLLQSFGPGLRSFVDPSSGRIYPRYNLARAASGRFSCEAPNTQQLPNARAPDFRRCIVAERRRIRRVLVCCDWSQIELRAAAWISGDVALTRVYAEGRDLHRETAASIIGCRPEDVTDAQRKGVKPVNFGAIYGIGAPKLVEYAFDAYAVEMTEQEAARALERFFATYPGLARWREENHELCERRRRVEIGCGRIVEARWETKQNGHLTFNQHCNLPVQGICADAMLRALTLTHERLSGLDAGLVACVHDELIVEAAEHDAERAKAILEEAMLEAFVVTFPGAPSTGVAQAGIGLTWLDARPG